MRRIKRGETLNRLELRLRRLDQGWEKIISYSGAMVESAIGERLMFVSAQDLTDQRRAEQSLRESEERLRLLGDNLPDSAVYQYVDELGGAGRYTYFSAGIERLNGVTAEDVLRDAERATQPDFAGTYGSLRRGQIAQQTRSLRLRYRSPHAASGWRDSLDALPLPPAAAS